MAAVTGGDYAALAGVFKALGDETRLRLVAELARRGQVTCGEFAVMCDCSNSALTYHQRVLGEAGLIAVRRAGQFRVLTLRHETFDAALPGFVEHLARSASGADDAGEHDALPLPPAAGDAGRAVIAGELARAVPVS